MATIAIRATANNKSLITNDICILTLGGKAVRFGFKVNPAGTVTGDSNVVLTDIGDIPSADVLAAIIAMQGVTIEHNPDWNVVKTDTIGDGVNDTGLYGWSKSGQLYEVVTV